MNRSFLLLFVFATAQLFADSPAERAKQPWEWSTDERVASRLDRNRIAQRLRAWKDQQTNRDRNGSVMPHVVSHSEIVDSATFVIDGSRNPELFMPWELMERFLNAAGSEAEGREHARKFHSRRIASFGWQVEWFWTNLDQLSARYAAARRELSGVELGADDTDVRTRRVSISRGIAAQRFCAARADALHEARSRFGGTTFDRFLYTVVAPNVTVFSDEPMNAEQLRSLEGGCR